MSNMKPLSLLVQKVWPRLSFFKSRSKVKFRVTKSKILVSTERTRHKEYTCVILKPHLILLKSYLSLLWTDRWMDRQTDRQTDRVIPIYPQTSFAGGGGYNEVVILNTKFIGRVLQM